jgi:hypothetical protein
MRLLESLQCPKRPATGVADVVALACVSAAMYRLQQSGDPLAIVWAAGAIIVLTAAVTIARALERYLSGVFGMAVPDDDPGGEASGPRDRCC